jgi:Fe-S cluster biosynthesis and repair protein YggX
LKGVKTEALNSSASIKEFGNISTEAWKKSEKAFKVLINGLRIQHLLLRH